MHDLHARIDTLITRDARPWVRTGRIVQVRLGRQGRQQRVRFGIEDGVVWFESTVLDLNEDERAMSRWHDLARVAWIRNASAGLVGFGFDAEDRLVGRVEYPLATIDDAEIVACIAEVAAECDRFERSWARGDAE